VGDPDVDGFTLEEEKAASNAAEWPNFEINFDFQNANLKLYGGAQYERLLNEFEFVAHSIEFPKTSINEVASAMGTAKSHNAPLFEAAASDIVRAKAKKTLLPLINNVLHRCTFIMRHLYKVALKVIVREELQSFGMVGKNEEFLKELQGVYYNFIQTTRDKCEEKLQDDFWAFTKILDWDLLSGLSEINDYEYLNVTQQETKARVEAIMGLNQPPLKRHSSHSRMVDEDMYKQVLMMAGKLFAGVRYFFTKYIRSKFNAFFLDPVFQVLRQHLTDYFRKISNERYKEMFEAGASHLKERATLLQTQLQKFSTQRDQCKEIVNRLKYLSYPTQPNK